MISEAALQNDAQISLATRLAAGTGVAGILAGAGVVAYFDPTKAGFFPVCPLYSLTGLACPGCGLTRGFHALFHGDVLGALDYNALLPMFALLVAFALVSMASVAFGGRRAAVRLIDPNYLWVFFVLLLVFGVARNLPWYPFTVLFP